MTLRIAELADEPAIRNLQSEAISWLTDKGLSQWQPEIMTARNKSKPRERGLAASIVRGETYVIDKQTTMLATFTLDDFADPDFWHLDDNPDDALYIHRMIVKRDNAGRGLGGHILDWAAYSAHQHEKTFLRLDAWRTNTRLHHYYMDHGFRHVRTVETPGRGSGALFERVSTSSLAQPLPWDCATISPTTSTY